MVINVTTLPLTTAVFSTTGIDLEISTSFDLDRYLGDTLTLPYAYEDLKIKSNELCIADNINAALKKLHHNFLYINANTKIASNDFPKRYKGFVASNSAIGSNDVTWYPSTSSTSVLANELSAPRIGTNSSILSGLVTGAFTEVTDATLGYVYVVAGSASLIGVSTDINTNNASINLNKTTIEDATALTFTDIRSIEFNSQNHLFVVDNYNIHKFDISSVLTTNRAVSSIGRFLIKTIGGRSKDIYDKDKFNKPISVAIGNDDDVYILDQNDKGFKVYDKDLNWKVTSSRGKDYIDANAGLLVSIAVDKTTDYVYILSDDGKVFEYTDEFKLNNVYILTDPLATDEKYRQLVFSKTSSDIVYFLTDKSLFKKFKAKLTKSIGAFRLEDNSITGETLAFVGVLNTDRTDYDYVHLGSNQEYTNVVGPIGKISRFDETVNYRTIVNDDYKIDTFPLSAIYVNSKEFVTSWVINKSFHKIIYNHLLFRDNIHFVYEGAYDSVGRVQHTNTRYIRSTDLNLSTYTTDLNNFVGINEPMFAEVVNRPLRQIYDLQISLLDMCKEVITNKHPYATQVTELK
jgi:hypothetical protein